MAGKYWQKELAEQYRSWVKSAFVKALQKMVPELTESDLTQGGSGVRAQAVDRRGNLVDDFHFVHGRNMIHVCNVPSPAATASLEIGKEIVEMMAQRFDLPREAGIRKCLMLSFSDGAISGHGRGRVHWLGPGARIAGARRTGPRL